MSTISALIACALTACSPPPKATPPLTGAKAASRTAALTTLLDDWYAAGDGHCVTFVEQSFSGGGTTTIGEGTPDPSPDADTPTATENEPLESTSVFFKKEESIAITRAGASSRVDLRLTGAASGMAHSLGRLTLISNTPAQARMIRRFGAGPDSREYVRIDAPWQRYQFNGAYYRNAVGWGDINAPSARSYADLFRHHLVSGPHQSIEPRRLHWRCAFPDPHGELPDTRTSSSLEVVFITDTEDPPMLREIRVRSYWDEVDLRGPMSNTTDGNLTADIRIQFPEGLRGRDGALIPDEVAVRIQQPREEGGFWGFVRLRRTGIAHSGELASDHFLIEPATTDATVSDSRQGIAFRLGDDTVNVDGRLLRTARPVNFSIIKNLREWVANGTFVDSTADTPESNDER